MRPCPRCGEVIERDAETCPHCGYDESEAPHVRERPIAEGEQKELEEEKMKRVSETEVRVMDVLLSLVPFAFPAIGAGLGYALGGVEGMIYGFVIGLVVMLVA